MDFVLPELGEGVYECEWVEWLVQPGQAVQHGQSLAEVLTDKATMEIPSPFSGQILELTVNDGAQVKVGDLVLRYEANAGDDAAATTSTAAASATSSAASSAASTSERTVAAAVVAATTTKETNGNGQVGVERSSVRAAPSVRRMARSLGIDLGSVRGSGKGGRILIDDLSAHVQQQVPGASPRRDNDLEIDLGQAGTEFKLTGVRRMIAENMVNSARTIPHYSYVDECDVSELVRLQRALKDKLGKRGIKLTYLAFVVKAAVEALQEVPIVNSTFDGDTNAATLHKQYHIGIATTTRKGLMVPVIRDADQRDLPDLAAEIDRLSSAARDGSIARDDLVGGTFTVTSIGSIGGLLSTPIINAPQVGILGVGKIVQRPMFDDAGRVVPAEMVYLSYSFDHRIVNGAVAAIFGNAINERLQQPAALLV